MQISSWHLFGVVPKNIPKPIVVAPEPVAPQEAPDTTLRLTLKGVAASRDMMSAWAIIADRMRNEDTYGIDDPLPDGAVLKEIYADRIILLHNGRLETLRLPEDNLPEGSNNRANRSSARANRRSNTRSTPRRTSSVPNGAVNQLSYEAAQVVKSYKQKLLSDPQSVMNTLRAEPYRQGGQLKGYRIFPGKDKQLFGQVGLQPGDVVTAVNGIELDSPLKGLEVMQNITDASEVSVNVLRNGVNQTYMVPLN
jgi:general secretion pathway protein C